MICRATHRRDERVAATGNVGDVAGPFAPVPERLSKAGDMDAESALFHVDVGPDPLDQISLGNDLSGAIDQRNEDVKRATADLKRLISSLHEPFGRK